MPLVQTDCGNFQRYLTYLNMLSTIIAVGNLHSLSDTVYRSGYKS